MAELQNGKPLSLEELMVSNSRDDGRARKATDRKGHHHGRGVQTEAAGGTCGLSAHSESDNAMIISSYNNGTDCNARYRPRGDSIG